jgi:hypothetical protein
MSDLDWVMTHPFFNACAYLFDRNCEGFRSLSKRCCVFFPIWEPVYRQILPSALCPLPSALCPLPSQGVYFLSPIFFSAFPSSSSVTSVAVVQLPIPLHST